tara:strand:+ start:245 stop:709 length:465 start_codon:yes stop_codon:yes gene_type:complete
MTSLTEQMEMLQKQQAILAEKIREEEERNKKLAQDASIERLEALIEPITQNLDWVCPNQNGVSYSGGSRSDWSTRRNLNSKFELQSLNRRDKRSRPITKYQISNMLVNEEIFVTLLGIIKKQDARISELEAINKVKNNEIPYCGQHAGESWNYS